MRILIRCDGADVPEIGTGHVVRMNLLAERLLEQNHEVSFVSRIEGSFSRIEHLLSGKFPIIGCYNEALIPNTACELDTLLSHNPEVVIFDRLATDEKVILPLKNKRVKVVSFDDNGTGSLVTDLTINSLVPSAVNKKNTSHIYGGYQFLISRSLEKFPNVASENGICFSFGGYDHQKIAKKILGDLDLNCFRDYTLYFIAGSEAYKNELEQAIHGVDRNNIGILVRPDNFYEILSQCRLVVISGGLTLFDTIKLEIPSITISQYEHQKYNIDKLAALNLTIPFDSNMGITVQIQEALDRKRLMVQNQNILDNQGLDRVVKIMQENVLQ